MTTEGRLASEGWWMEFVQLGYHRLAKSDTTIEQQMVSLKAGLRIRPSGRTWRNGAVLCCSLRPTPLLYSLPRCSLDLA